MYDLKLNGIMAVLGGICGYLFGGFDVMLSILLMFMLCDMITGIIKGRNKLYSNTLYMGIMKKSGMLIVIFICVQTDILLKIEVLRTACIMFYIANEALSIMENLAMIGVPIPAFIKDKLELLKKENEVVENDK